MATEPVSSTGSIQRWRPSPILPPGPRSSLTSLTAKSGINIHILEGECTAFLASGSEPTAAE